MGKKLGCRGGFGTKEMKEMKELKELKELKETMRQ
jgi:hypothetical protein